MRLAMEAIGSQIRRPNRQQIARALSATFVAVLVIIALGACGSSSSSTSSKASTTSTSPAAPTGTYAAKVTHLGPGSGTYTLTFAQGGSVIVKRDGVTTGGTHNRVKGNTLTTSNRCNGRSGGGVGTYTLQVTGKELKFTRVKDLCTGRSIVLAYTFIKVG